MLENVAVERIELGREGKNFEIYESFYFRGNLENSPYSFWLKHNLIQFRGDPNVRVDNLFVVFDDQKRITQTFQQSRVISSLEFQSHFQKKQTWKQIHFEFSNGGFFSIQLGPQSGGGYLKGFIPGQVSWNFTVIPSGQPYFHFDHDWFYTGFFPKKKILTADCFLQFRGKVVSPMGEWDGQFQGMNGHNWGREHAFQYAYSNCNEFTENGVSIPRTFFDCFSAKIQVAGMKSPFLSAGSLFYQGRWYDFNRVLKSFQPEVKEFSLKTYSLKFQNDEFELDLTLNGQNHAWVRLEYDHPSRKKSFVNNTKHAEGQLILKTSSGELIAQLQSSAFELETLVDAEQLQKM